MGADLRVRLVRGGMAVLAAVNLWWGGWALLRPRHFFDTFPGFGFQWTSAYPPFNHHLVADLGATFATLGLLLAVGAAQRQRPVRLLALSGVLAFNALHLAFHSWHRGSLTALDYGLSIGSLIAGVLAPAALLFLDRPPRPRQSPRPDLPPPPPSETP